VGAHEHGAARTAEPLKLLAPDGEHAHHLGACDHRRRARVGRDERELVADEGWRRTEGTTRQQPRAGPQGSAESGRVSERAAQGLAEIASARPQPPPFEHARAPLQNNRQAGCRCTA
jgi:hypothetical protein